MIHIIYYCMFVPFALHSMYFLLMGLFAFIKRRKIAEFQPKNRFAVIIPARNESLVIENLLKSLSHQNYPSQLFDIYVVPNNCTDDTEQIARRAGARILSVSGPIRTKGDVLKKVYARLLRDEHYDAFVIFDADNLVHPDFLRRMNDALCSGYEAAQGFRDSKNPNENWISGNSSIYFWLLNIFFDRSRMNIGKSAVINGTGFMVKTSVLSEIGYNPVTITEDIEFSIHCALHNKKIAFVENAIIYDEQPFDMKTSLKQRNRWSAGNYQCFFTYWKPLVLKALRDRDLTCVDMILLTSGSFWQITFFLISCVVMLNHLRGIQFGAFSTILFSFDNVSSTAFAYFSQVVMAAFAVLLTNRKAYKAYSSALMFPIFLLTWLPLNIMCLFNRNIRWEPIVHRKSIDIKDAIRGKN